MKNFESIYINGKNSYKVWWYWNQKTKKFHRHKRPISIKIYIYIYINKIRASNKVSFGEKQFKFFASYKDAKK